MQFDVFTEDENKGIFVDSGYRARTASEVAKYGFFV